MDYSVSQLAQISGVSVRTLHWYDEIDLLKPSYHAVNGYRHYGEELIGSAEKSPDFLEEEKESLAREAMALYREICACMKRGAQPNSDEVQRLIGEHYRLMVHAVGVEVYRAYAKLYVERAEVRKTFDALDPELAEFLAEAMHSYADGV